MRTPLLLALLLATTSGAACAGRTPPVSDVRFANQDPVWQVNDRVHTPAKPADNPWRPLFYYGNVLLFDAVDQALRVPERRRAQNVNALDEVPNSTWFTNRIGVRDLSVEEVRRGPNHDESPEQHRPWKITSAKTKGVAPGFFIEDARGYRYLLKFDVKGHPESESGANVIGQRIFYAFGFNVPQDYVVEFQRGDLVLAPDATVEMPRGERPMTRADLDAEFERIEVGPDGRIRGLASRFVPGEVLGGHPQEGTRDGDPNDLVPHEHRRDLRGTYALAAWLSHPDIKESNSLDTWVSDPDNEGHRYVLHYWIDFGKALGQTGVIGRRISAGHDYAFSLEKVALPMLTAGLYRRPWDDYRPPTITGLGHFDVEHFDPAGFRPNVPYRPFQTMDRFDGFWAAKIIMRFTPAQLRAIVEEARYSDPRATEHTLRTLIGRQRKTGHYWFRQVAPLDRFSIEPRADGYRLCFDDLLLVYDLASEEERATSYRAVAFDERGRPTGWRGTSAPNRKGRACVIGLQPAIGAEGYTIVKLETQRGEQALPATEVHLARDRDGGRLRVVGLHRR